MKNTFKALILATALSASLITPAMAAEEHHRSHEQVVVKNSPVVGVGLLALAGALVYASLNSADTAPEPAPAPNLYVANDAHMPAGNVSYYQDSEVRKRFPMNVYN